MIVRDDKIMQIAAIVEGIVVDERPFPNVNPSLHFEKILERSNL